MTDPAPRFTVLHSSDGGRTWTRHAGIIATSTEQAIERVRQGDDELAADPEALFFATQRFTIRKLRKQLVEKWSLEMTEEPEDGPEESGLGRAE